MADPDPDLTALQKAWTPSWKIWRARRWRADGLRDGPRDGDYVASRMDDSAGVYPTVMCRNPNDLHEALQAQAAAKADGTLSAPEPRLWP